MRRTSVAKPIANAVFLRSKAGKEEELAGRLEELVRASRSDPGVMIYDLHRSATDPASWFLYERYESQEHFNKHRENPVLRQFTADIPTLLDGKLDVRTFDLIADVDSGATPFSSAGDLAAAFRRASAAHAEHEKRIGAADPNWPDWYAEYMVREQAGTGLPQCPRQWGRPAGETN